MPTPPSAFPSFASLLRAEWSELTADLVAVVGDSNIKRSTLNDPGSSLVFIGFPERNWGDDPVELIQRRHDVLARFERWLARFRLLFQADIPEITTKIDGVEEFVRSWLQRNQNDHSIPTTIDRAKEMVVERCSELDGILDQVAPTADATPIAVIDTNALLRCPDLAKHGNLFPDGKVIIAFVPAVLSELDDLKDRGRTTDVRDDAAKVVKRIKGLRDRGSLTSGVTIEGSIRAIAIATEPDFSALPRWLDRSVPDDRLLGAVLGLQASRPTSPVVLVTSDINMCNKADFAGVPTLEPPS